MAKPIKVTDEHLNQFREACRTDFDKMLAEAKLTNGQFQFSFTRSLSLKDRKAKVFFSEVAWLKTTALLDGFAKEVAWHATAYRADGDNDNYFIGDVMVYPQKVGPASVDMDEVEYSKWLIENIEDERFDNIHAQMHSHVHMAVNPSGTDLSHQEEILRQLPPDGFYIFMIWNKRHDVNIKIYDLQKNIMFDSADITYCVVDGFYGLQKFMSEAKSVVREEQRPTYSGNTTYQYNQNKTNTTSIPPAAGNNTTSGPYNPVGNGNKTSTPAGNTPPKKDGDKKGNKDKGKGGKGDKKKTKFRNEAPKEQDWTDCCLTDDPTFFDADGNPYDMTDPFGYNDGPLYNR